MKALVVSRNYDHLYEESMETVLGLLYAGKARVLSFSDRLMKISHRQRHDLAPEFRALMDGWDTLRLPHAVVLLSTRKSRRPFFKALTRNHLFERDGHLCQYDDCQETRDLTVDHVYPKSRFLTGEFRHLPFGLRSWENLVTACHAHNNRKGDRTPDEAGMSLKRPPVTPTNQPDPAMWDRIYPKES